MESRCETRDVIQWGGENMIDKINKMEKRVKNGLKEVRRRHEEGVRIVDL